MHFGLEVSQYLLVKNLALEKVIECLHAVEAGFLL